MSKFDRENLRFVFESVDGEMVFTFPYYVDDDDEGQRGVYINVYTLPTSRILTLE